MTVTAICGRFFCTKIPVIAMTTTERAWELGFPFSWLNDVREFVLVSNGEPDEGQSTIINNNSPDIVIPSYGRLALRLSLDSNICYLPWIPINIVPLAVPIPNEIRRDYEVVLQPRIGQNLTFQIINANELATAPFS